jgi:carboxymethylenebutenolidase
LPPVEQLATIQSPVLGMYAELDHALTLWTPPVITAMISMQKTFGFHIYQGVGHAFHNDTGPSYDPAAACNAWYQTIAWFNKFLRTSAAEACFTIHLTLCDRPCRRFHGLQDLV